MRITTFHKEIRNRGKTVITSVLIGLRKTVLAVGKYMFVSAYFFGLSLFLFREVLVREGVVAFEDLAPFFSQSQLHEFQFSSWVKYTQGIPFRARSNPLFLWPRYLPLLRVSLVLITTLAGLLFFFSIIIVFKLTLKEKVEKRHFALAIISSTYALFILLPAKLSHFNTLVLGAAFMSLALSFFIKALLETALMKSLVLTSATAALLHMTPNIEQVVVFYAGISFLVFVSILLNGKIKKTLSLFAIIFLVHAAPYLVYIFFVTGSGIIPEIYKTVYTSYEFIKGGSVNPLRFASSGHTSQISRYLTGFWAPPLSIMFLFQAGFCMLSLIKFRKSKTVQMIFSLYLLAFFFALGFKSPISGYVAILKLSELIPFLRPIARATLFQVLRNPQRWMFLETYVRMVLFGLSAMTVLNLIKTKLSLKRGIRKRSLTFVKTFSYIFIVFFMVSPFLVYPYNLVFTGDFGGAFKPANIPQGMGDTKEIITNSAPSGKIISFPLIGRKTVEWSGLRLFLSDEFYNFYFETPSIEGVSGVSTLNQLSMFFGYHLLYYNRSSSIGRYFSSLGVKYIFFHNDVTQDSLANESTRILYSLESQTDLILRYQNEEYYLFEVMNQEVNANSIAESKSLIFFYDTLWTPWTFLSEFNLTSQGAVFVDLVSGDTSWSQFNSIVERIGNNTALFLPRAYFEDKDVVLSLLLKEKGVLVTPSFTDLLEFEKNGWVVPPARYPRYFEYLDEYGVYGEFGATDDVFIASSEPNVVATFRFDVPKKDTYNMYAKLHAPDGAKVLLDVDGRLDQIEINGTATYKFIQIFEGNLNKGHHKVSIKKLDKRPLVINLVYLIGSEQFSNYANEFSDFINNRHMLMSDKYSDIVDHVSKLSYPRNLTIYYYNGDLYSNNLAFRVKDEICSPIKTVYSGSFLILDVTSNSGDIEPIHLPDEKVIRYTTFAYVTYIALLWVGLGLVVMRLRRTRV